MQTFSNAVKVGIVMSLALGAFAYWFFATTKGNLGATSYALFAYIPDAAGLSMKSKVSLGGMTVGIIEDIQLVDMDGEAVPPEDRADHTGKPRHGYYSRVQIRVKKQFPLRSDVKLAKETEGLIGSKILRFYPAAGDWDHPENLAAYLKDGEQIRHVEWEGDLDKVANLAKGIGGQIQSLIDLNKDEVTDIIRSVRDFMGPDPSGAPPPSFPGVVNQLRDTMKDLDHSITKLLKTADSTVGENRQTIKEVLENINRVSSELKSIAEGTGERGVALDTMVRNVTLVTEDLRKVVADIRDITGGAGAGADGGPGGADGIKRSVEKLNKNLEHLEVVTGRIEKGEGNVGRFLNDEKLINDVEEMVDGAAGYVTGLTGTETHVDIMSWYNMRQGAGHTGISIKFQPKPDKYYLFELVQDPKRGSSNKLVTTRNLTDGSTKVESISEISDNFRVTIMWAKMWGPLTLRIGLMEGNGAVGGNLNFWDNRIQFRADLFQFAEKRLPRFRGYGQFSPIPHFYVLAGIDDPLNSNVPGMVPKQYLPYALQRDYIPFDWRDPNSYGAVDLFMGGGITFTDDDLRAAFTQIPTGMIK